MMEEQTVLAVAGPFELMRPCDWPDCREVARGKPRPGYQYCGYHQAVKRAASLHYDLAQEGAYKYGKEPGEELQAWVDSVMEARHPEDAAIYRAHVARRDALKEAMTR